MSKIKNGGLDQYGAEPSEQQQFGTAGVEGLILAVWYKRVYKRLTVQEDDANIKAAASLTSCGKVAAVD